LQREPLSIGVPCTVWATFSRAAETSSPEKYFHSAPKNVKMAVIFQLQKVIPNLQRFVYYGNRREYVDHCVYAGIPQGAYARCRRLETVLRYYRFVSRRVLSMKMNIRKRYECVGPYWRNCSKFEICWDLC